MNVTKPTFTRLSQQRSLMASTNFNGFNDTARLFVPSNRFDAKRSIKRNDFGLFLEEYNHKHQADMNDYFYNKSKRLASDFKHSYTNERLRSELKRT